jgi:hypothetical protein
MTAKGSLSPMVGTQDEEKNRKTEDVPKRREST